MVARGGGGSPGIDEEHKFHQCERIVGRIAWQFREPIACCQRRQTVGIHYVGPDLELEGSEIVKSGRSFTGATAEDSVAEAGSRK